MQVCQSLLRHAPRLVLGSGFWFLVSGFRGNLISRAKGWRRVTYFCRCRPLTTGPLPPRPTADRAAYCFGDQSKHACSSPGGSRDVDFASQSALPLHLRSVEYSAT